VCIVVALWAGRAPLLTLVGHLLIVDDAVAPADYLVVLGGSADDRPFTAADLYRRHFAPKVVIFEYPQNAGGAPSHTELYRSILELEGVPSDAIVQAPRLVRTSWDEAESLRSLLAGHRTAGVMRVIVVTSAQHTRRAGWAFRQALAGLAIDVRTAAARHPDFDETNWWRHDEAVLLYVHEFLKIPFYLVRYRSAGSG
jgi:uncharacterized SAM-binding protein YcdF (DUF218 family)